MKGKLVTHSLDLREGPCRGSSSTMRDSLTPFEQSLILSSFPTGSRPVGSTSFPGHNKRYPLRVTIATPTGQQQTVVLRQDDKPGGSDLESQLLPVLDRLGL